MNTQQTSKFTNTECDKIWEALNAPTITNLNHAIDGLCEIDTADYIPGEKITAGDVWTHFGDRRNESPHPTDQLTVGEWILEKDGDETFMVQSWWDVKKIEAAAWENEDFINEVLKKAGL